MESFPQAESFIKIYYDSYDSIGSSLISWYPNPLLFSYKSFSSLFAPKVNIESEDSSLGLTLYDYQYSPKIESYLWSFETGLMMFKIFSAHFEGEPDLIENLDTFNWLSKLWEFFFFYW